MAFAAVGNRQLQLGYPVYAWTKARGDSARLDSSAAVAGVLQRDSVATALPSPFARDIATDFRLRATDDGKSFYAIFARAIAPGKQGHDPQIFSYWFGRTDGLTWDSVQALPVAQIKNNYDIFTSSPAVPGPNEPLEAIAATAEENLCTMT